MNLLIKGACDTCGHDFQLLPEEGPGEEDNYHCHCGVCGAEGEVHVSLVGDPPIALIAKASRSGPKLGPDKPAEVAKR